MSGSALLDVNFLIALFDPDHPHHEVAHDWFDDNHARGWATCPVTENGFIRVVANPKYGNEVTQAPVLIERLRKFCASGHYQFWDDAVSFRDERLFNGSLVRGHRQLTDIYLLGLAAKRGGRLVTFDQKIPLAAVKGATRAALEVVSSSE